MATCCKWSRNARPYRSTSRRSRSGECLSSASTDWRACMIFLLCIGTLSAPTSFSSRWWRVRQKTSSWPNWATWTCRKSQDPKASTTLKQGRPTTHPLRSGRTNPTTINRIFGHLVASYTRCWLWSHHFVLKTWTSYIEGWPKANTTAFPPTTVTTCGSSFKACYRSSQIRDRPATSSSVPPSLPTTQKS